MPPKKMPLLPTDSLTATATATATAPAAVSKAAASAAMLKVNPNESDRLQLAQSINNVVLRGESFVASMELLNTFSKERLVDLDMKIEAKKQEYQDLTAQLSNHYKDVEIKLKQHVQEHKMDAVKEILTSLHMMPIDIAEHTRLVDLKATSAQQLQEALDQEKSLGKAALTQALHNQNLQHKADLASLEAQVTQQVKEITVLKETISNLKHEIAEQRSLTKEVAIASSKGNIQQSFGGKS